VLVALRHGHNCGFPVQPDGRLWRSLIGDSARWVTVRNTEAAGRTASPTHHDIGRTNGRGRKTTWAWTSCSSIISTAPRELWRRTSLHLLPWSRAPDHVIRPFIRMAGFSTTLTRSLEAFPPSTTTRTRERCDICRRSRRSRRTSKDKNDSAEIVVHPSGKFLYGSTADRHDRRVRDGLRPGHAQTGRNRTTQGKTPRSFAVDPSGKYLLAANQDSNNVVRVPNRSKTAASRRAARCLRSLRRLPGVRSID